MKHRSVVPLLILLGLLAACGQGQSAQSSPAASEPEVTAPAASAQALSSPPEVPQALFDTLLSGDLSAVENTDVWGSPPIGYAPLELEYTTLDLDGDGVCELLIQGVDDPCNYNGVFHADGTRLACWQNDMMELSCRDYPLQDGTMVRQYDTLTGPSRYSQLYTLFRYQSDGSQETVAQLSVHEDTSEDGSTSVTYQLDGAEVEQADFEGEFQALITGRLLERTAWTPVPAQNQGV